MALQVGGDVLTFAGQIEIGGDVVSSARQVAFERQQAFQPLPLAHYLLRFFRIRPQIGIRRLLFDFGKLLAQFTRVKDTPAGRGPWSSKKCIAVPVHPTFSCHSSYLIRLNSLLKNSRLILGGAALQRCGESAVFSTGFSR